MSISRHVLCAATVIGFAFLAAYSAIAASAIKLSDVASAEDLVTEVSATVEEIERGLVSPDAYTASAGKLRRSAIQLAVFAQALAEHDEDSKFKAAAPAMRDSALRFAQAKSYDDARDRVMELKQSLDATGSSSAQVEYDWSKLAGRHALMDSMRERTDLVRKALRRPKDPASESRHAAMMAILALAIDAHADGVKQQDDKPVWHSTSLDLQRSMTLTARAMRARDAGSAVEHFTAGHEACDRCHDKFKR